MTFVSITPIEKVKTRSIHRSFNLFERTVGIRYLYYVLQSSQVTVVGTVPACDSVVVVATIN